MTALAKKGSICYDGRYTIHGAKWPGTHVHARRLLVGAEQRRRAGNLDHLDLAALGVGRVGQALVRARGALVLRNTRDNLLSAPPRQLGSCSLISDVQACSQSTSVAYSRVQANLLTSLVAWSPGGSTSWFLWQLIGILDR